jgi:hypothetical protein
MVFRTRKIKTKYLKKSKQVRKADNMRMRYLTRTNFFDEVVFGLEKRSSLMTSTIPPIPPVLYGNGIFRKTFVRSCWKPNNVILFNVFQKRCLHLGELQRQEQESIPVLHEYHVVLENTIIIFVHHSFLKKVLIFVQSKLTFYGIQVVSCNTDSRFFVIFISIKTHVQLLNSFHAILDFLCDLKQSFSLQMIPYLGVVTNGVLFTFDIICMFFQSYLYFKNNKSLIPLYNIVSSEIQKIDFFGKLFDPQYVGRDKRVFVHPYYVIHKSTLFYDPLLCTGLDCKANLNVTKVSSIISLFRSLIYLLNKHK